MKLTNNGACYLLRLLLRLNFLCSGLFLIGWLVDICLIPSMVEDCNRTSPQFIVVAGGGGSQNVNQNIIQVSSPAPPQGYGAAYPTYQQMPPQGYPPQQQQWGAPPQGYPQQQYPQYGAPQQQQQYAPQQQQPYGYGAYPPQQYPPQQQYQGSPAQSPYPPPASASATNLDNKAPPNY